MGKTIVVDSEKIGITDCSSKLYPKTNGVIIFPLELKIFYCKYSKDNWMSPSGTKNYDSPVVVIVFITFGGIDPVLQL